MNPPALKFSEAAADQANRAWKCSCGPLSIAALLGLTLDEVRAAFLNFPGWCNPTILRDALRHFRVEPEVKSGLKTRDLPTNGIARVQFEGTWLNPGVNPKAAYRYTHWIAARDGSVFDPIWTAAGWLIADDWRSAADKYYPDRKITGWHITHHYELRRGK